ncbi:MAG: DUF1343 domain-containing protein [Gemmatimonadota bacterium]|nr:MAG: DUF1343 domain-containing protein [Gemmatimonadota bacterium]
MNRKQVTTGLGQLLAGAGPDLSGARLGLIAHPASVTHDLVPSADALSAAGFNLTAMYGPQHGARGEKQDNMIESASFMDDRLDVPVYSLYGDVRKPTPEMLEHIDVMLFDLQDVGVRVYTFVWTMTLAMEACRDAGVAFVVLDRPNPITGVMREGPTLQRGFESFVGLYPIPLRHGLTAGEIARLCNDAFGINCELDVVPCGDWSREQWYDQTALPFVLPSPNLPTLDSCNVYPGMVLLEGTNLSEGRGTTRPFELFGAPYLDAQEVATELNRLSLPGVVFRPCQFEPTFQKHAGQLCGGAQLHVIDRALFRPVQTAVTIISMAQRLAPDSFAWREPPYEYEADKMPIDILWGSENLRIAIDRGSSPDQILNDVSTDVAEFNDLARPYLLYN